MQHPYSFKTKHNLCLYTHEGFVHVTEHREEQNNKSERRRLGPPKNKQQNFSCDVLAAGYSECTVPGAQSNATGKRHGRDHTALMGVG